MIHPAEKYVGMEWTEEFDCAALVRKVLEEEYGIEAALPAGMDWKRTDAEAASLIAREFADEVSEGREGDAVLMRIRGDRRDLGSHIGLLFKVRCEPFVLHNMERVGVMFSDARSLERLQLEICGYYRLK